MRYADHYVKVYHKDLVKHGTVRNRTDQHFQIKAGILPPPHKEGDPNSQQATAFWWPEEIDAANDRERERRAAMEAAE
jgi:hypothetical protein